MKMRGSAYLLVALVASGLANCSRVAMIPPPPPAVVVPEGRFRGILALDNAIAVPLSGAVITSEGARAVANEQGVFAFEDLPPGKHLLVAEKRIAAGKVRRLLGVATVFVENGPADLRIRMRDATDVDAFCLDCHPPLKGVSRRDQIARDIHPSGIVPKKANKPAGRFDGKGRITCESCHSVHRETGFPHFTLVSYKDGKLCVQCH